MLWPADEGVGMKAFLEQAVDQGFLRPIDYHLALFLYRLEKDKQEELLLAAALVSRAVGQGHTCLLLDNDLKEPFFDGEPKIPSATKWRKILLGCRTVAEPGGIAPLILDSNNRLYLYRFFRYEEQIVSSLLGRSSGMGAVSLQQVSGWLQILFPDALAADGQMRAAAQALFKNLLVISGGPGTGKTYTVARILALLNSLHPNLRVGLAAPTGKAAARVQESLQQAKKSLPSKMISGFPDQAQTLHRLLGFTGEGGFRYDKSHPLPLDLLVVDEASMVDIPLMAALVNALPESCRLILLGDRDQLASVEAGSLFSDLCGQETHGLSPPLCDVLQQLTGTSPPSDAHAPPLADSVAFLATSYRFSGESGIGLLARAVNSGDGKQVDHVLGENHSDLAWISKRGIGRQKWLRDKILHGFTTIFSAQSVAEALQMLGRFRILCALHNGPDGVEAINSLAEKTLAASGLIYPEQWYRGLPIMIKKNNYNLQLFNGDTGILWPDDSGKLLAWFMGVDGRIHPVAPVRLPAHDTAYAITVHKSQGSEFDEIVFVLPQEDSRVLSRELLYTGLTRAKTRLSICADRDILQTAIGQRIIRHSGLSDKIWKTGDQYHP